MPANMYAVSSIMYCERNPQLLMITEMFAPPFVPVGPVLINASTDASAAYAS